MASIFGLDFGTTNSVATVIGRSAAGEPERALVLTNRDDNRPHPSVVWYHGADTIVGRKAKAQLNQLGLGVFGDIVRSPKIYLGSPVGMNVGGVNRPAVNVVADVLKFLRDDALSRHYPGHSFDRAVLTIPVSMEGRARRELRQAALMAGIRVHQFVHEPLAALYGHLRARPDYQQYLAQLERRQALVFDWGGGTLDLTLCKFSGGALIQVLNLGDPEVGGDKFDLRLVNLVKQRHEKRYPIVDWTQLQPSAEARIINACEGAKIDLSQNETHTVFVPDILAAGGSEKHLEVELSRRDLEQIVEDLVRRGLGCIRNLLDSAEIPASAVEFCLATGGMVAVPAIRHGLLEIFGMARLRIVDNAATIISEGAAWIAHDGLTLKLAKPLELLHAHNHYTPIVHSRTTLPIEGEQIRNIFSMYCVDPRDSFAKFEFARPKWPDRESSQDVRIPYTHLTIEVDPHAAPLAERLEVEVRINHDLIATVSAESQLARSKREKEIHDLEFGLGLDGHEAGLDGTGIENQLAQAPNAQEPTITRSQSDSRDAVRVRSNVTVGQHDWDLVPGEIVQKHRPITDQFLTSLQRAEKMYYVSCSECGRTIYEIERDGCDPCAVKGRALSKAEALARREARTRDSMANSDARRNLPESA
jgi:molecular chaperone DnaK (HSP70)